MNREKNEREYPDLVQVDDDQKTHLYAKLQSIMLRSIAKIVFKLHIAFIAIGLYLALGLGFGLIKVNTKNIFQQFINENHWIWKDKDMYKELNEDPYRIEKFYFQPKEKDQNFLTVQNLKNMYWFIYNYENKLKAAISTAKGTKNITFSEICYRTYPNDNCYTPFNIGNLFISIFGMNELFYVTDEEVIERINLGTLPTQDSLLAN